MAVDALESPRWIHRVRTDAIIGHIRNEPSFIHIIFVDGPCLASGTRRASGVPKHTSQKAAIITLRRSPQSSAQRLRIACENLIIFARDDARLEARALVVAEGTTECAIDALVFDGHLV